MSAFDNATLMITGGTGSFGSTVLKHFLDSDLKEIRIFSRDEKKQDDMRHELQAKHPENAKKVKFYIGDVRNPQSIFGGQDLLNSAFHIQTGSVMAGVGLVCHSMYLAVDDKLIVVQVTVIRSNTEIMAHILAAQTLLTGHQSLEQLLAVTGADDVRAGIAEQLLDSLSQIADGGSIRLLDEQITGICMLESEQDQIHSLVQVHQKAGHVGVGDGDGVASLDLIDKQRNDRTTAAHDIAVTSAADGRAATLRSHTGVCVDDVLHHGFGDAHGVDGVSSLVGGQADNTLDASVNSGVQHIISTDDVGLDGLHGEELAGRDLLQSSSVEDVVNTGHSVTDVQNELKGIPNV